MSTRFDTQQNLIDATRYIIINEGAEGFTLENICSRAGYSRGAFYSNFATKDSLLAALAEDEYIDLIDRLKAKVEEWEQTPHESGDAAMEDLLFDALDSIGVNRSLYVLHSELLTRSVRDVEWGARLLDLNDEFVQALSDVLAAILEGAGRKPTRPMRALTHAVIGIVLRAAGIDALRNTARYRAQATKTSRLMSPAMVTIEPEEIPETTNVADSPARDIVEMILLLLYAASEPVEDAKK